VSKAPKPRAVNFDLIEEKVDGKRSEPYRVLDEMIKYHSDVEHARIALAWRKRLRPDVDGHLKLGMCVKISEREKAVHPETRYDFVILLNREVWQDIGFTMAKKRALMDHELCHAAPVLNKKTLEPVYDDNGRAVYRSRKHDIEEFREIVERHGCYKADLEKFAEALLKAKKSGPALFEKVFDKVAEQINAGALDTKGIKVTAEVRH
jgi:hypothetical protein